MSHDAYRYEFDSSVPTEELEATLVLAVLGVASLLGESQTRLDVTHALDPERRVVVIAADTEAGRCLNRLFTGYATREYGDKAFRVIRKPARHAEPATA